MGHCGDWARRRWEYSGVDKNPKHTNPVDGVDRNKK
jgi:hypothetical protein